MTEPDSAARTTPGSHDALGGGLVTSTPVGSLVLESGATVPDATLAWRHDGPGPGAPQIVVVHALTGSADAAGDWWTPLIGPGRAMDTDRVGVICANLLGGCYGSTGPTSTDPSTGLAYGESFPAVSTRDQADAIWRLLDVIGIERLALVTGGSLGGMVALELAALRPSAVDVALPMAAPAATGAMAVAWNHIQLQLLDRLGDDGLAIARELAMTTYRSEADFDGRFGRSTGDDGRFSIVSYLDYQGRKLIERFDRDTYRVLVGAMDRHDLGRDRGGIAAALAGFAAAGTRLVGLGISGDILYGPAQVHELVETAAAAGVVVAYRELNSTKGHDAFLVEWDQLTDVIRDALAIAEAKRADEQSRAYAVPG